MKTSCVKYLLLAFSVGTLCTDVHALALSRKNKAVIKSGALGTFYTALALGAGYLTKEQFTNTWEMMDTQDNANRARRFETADMARTIGINSLLTGLIAGSLASKSAYKALNYFKQMKRLSNQKFNNMEPIVY